MNDLYLQHHGIKGQRWGIRRYQNADGSLTLAGKKRYNDDYQSYQRSRDRGVYGRSGVRRINKSMNKGMGITEARSREASRIYKHRRAGVYAGTAGSVAGGIGGAIGGYYLTKKIMKKYGTGDPFVDSLIKSFAISGTAEVGKILGRAGGRSIAMLAGGYNPKKFRYG